jgi:hypothetical protein
MQHEPSSASSTAPRRPLPAQDGIARPPRTEVSEIRDRRAFAGEVDKLKKQLKGMVTKKRFFSRLSAQESARNARVGRCLNALDAHRPGSNNFVMRDGGKLVGVMSIEEPPKPARSSDALLIQSLVSLPDMQGVDRRAVEIAVQLSVQTGRGGRVDLKIPQTTDVDEAFFDSNSGFDALGFVASRRWAGDRMSLSQRAIDAYKQGSGGTSP